LTLVLDVESGSAARQYSLPIVTGFNGLGEDVQQFALFNPVVGRR
jgi:hypothetical protein